MGGQRRAIFNFKITSEKRYQEVTVGAMQTMEAGALKKRGAL